MPTRSARWGVPLSCLLLGIAYLVVFWVSGNPVAGIGPFAIMVAYGALLFFGGRSDILRVLRGQPPDERYASLNIRAMAFAGLVTISAVLGLFFYEISQGRTDTPYGVIGAVAAVAYIGSLLVLGRRS
jgi:hypothetical protein